jgi:hypothetical protein
MERQYITDDLEVAVLQRGRHRFEWQLRDKDGTAVARGRSTSVAQARLDGLRSLAKNRGVPL